MARSNSFITLYKPNGRSEYVEFPFGSILVEEGTQRRFRVLGAMRQGGNGVVWQADEVDNAGDRIRQCALKMLKQHDAVRIDRFRNEVRVHRTLSHSRIATFHGAGEAALGESSTLIPWAAMDLGGPNLRDYQDENGRFDWPTGLAISLQATDAIAHLHAKELIHRDIKPANFVWSTPDSRDALFMIDFGLAKYAGEDVSMRQMDSFTLEREFVGPQNWMSPELLAYARDKSYPVDQRSDLFQLGLLIWYFATNRVLAGTPSPRFDPTGGPLRDLVGDLTQEDPADRPSTAVDVLVRLGKLT